MKETEWKKNNVKSFEIVSLVDYSKHCVLKILVVLVHGLWGCLFLISFFVFFLNLQRYFFQMTWSWKLELSLEVTQLTKYEGRDDRLECFHQSVMSHK